MSEKRLVFATNNSHKLKEIKEILEGKYDIVSLKDIGFSGDIPETGETLHDNASQKAHYIHDIYKTDCFADDTGLEVDALNGEPGVYSARYAGENCSYSDNVRKLLNQMEGKTLRSARFKTVISLILDGKEYFFEGVVEGKIVENPKGDSGFGYDPVFMPEGYDKTFAQMPPGLKNKISHRGKAVKKLAEFLKSL
jgi:XTP/dITP diphosphohydrolase